MNKTIEEAAWNFARKQWGKQVPHSVNKIADMLIDFGNEVMTMPLSDRLTAEEKERVRAMYSGAQSWLDEETSFDNPNEQLRLCAVAIQDRLERIFGEDFFKEGE